MYNWFEKITSNSDIDWIRPEEVGALTDSPILGIVGRDDDGEIETLARHGYCIFEYGGDE